MFEGCSNHIEISKHQYIEKALNFRIKVTSGLSNVINIIVISNVLLCFVDISRFANFQIVCIMNL